MTPVVPLVSVIAPRLANLLQTSSFVKRALPVGLQSTVPVPGAAVTKSPPRQVKALEMAKIELAKHNARLEVFIKYLLWTCFMNYTMSRHSSCFHNINRRRNKGPTQY